MSGSFTSHVRNAIASRERQVVMRKVKSTIPAPRNDTTARASQLGKMKIILEQFLSPIKYHICYQDTADIQTNPAKQPWVNKKRNAVKL